MSWSFNGPTQKYLLVSKIINNYINANRHFYSRYTSWVRYAEEFKNSVLNKSIYPDDMLLGILVRELCNKLTAVYSLTDNSSLKSDLLNIVGVEDPKPAKITFKKSKM